MSRGTGLRESDRERIQVSYTVDLSAREDDGKLLGCYDDAQHIAARTRALLDWVDDEADREELRRIAQRAIARRAD